MVSQQLLEDLDLLLRLARRCDRPFGGLQIVFCGDFCQLGSPCNLRWPSGSSPLVPPVRPSGLHRQSPQNGIRTS
jgi:hypothetical protein